MVSREKDSNFLIQNGSLNLTRHLSRLDFHSRSKRNAGESPVKMSLKNLRTRVVVSPRSLRVSSAQQDGGAAARVQRFIVIVM